MISLLSNGDWEKEFNELSLRELQIFTLSKKLLEETDTEYAYA